MQVLSFGSLNIDYVYSVSHFARAGETLNTEGRNLFAGGKGLNQAISIAKSGTSVFHAGRIGADGEFLKDILNNAGVNTSLIETVNTPTGHTVIQVDKNGENCILLYGGANRAIEKDYVDRVLSGFEKGDILVLQNEINNLEYIIEQGYSKGMRIILNPSPFDDRLKQFDLGKISVLILNELEAAEFAGYGTTEEICEFFKKNHLGLDVMLTLGKRGCVFINGKSGKTQFCPAFSVNAMDTTCAGDTFTGYFISGLIENKSILSTLKTASAASAIAVSRQGAAASIPQRAEVLKALETLKPTVENKKLIIKEKSEKYIAENLQGATLEELSQALGFSKNYTCSLIKEITGESFSMLLQKKRCEKAAEYLKSTTLSIDEIIHLCGYENGSFFRKAFKKYYFKSPLEYRKFYEEK